jgi:hypothetical protein
MNKYFLLLFSFFLLGKLLSQNSEVGVSVLAFSSIVASNDQKDSLSHGKQKGISDFQPVITYNHINSKGLDLFAQAGYFYIPSKVQDKTFDGGRAVYYMNGKSLIKSVYLKLGIAKRYTKDKLTLITGINIPFQYCYFKEAHTSISIYTIKNDTLTAQNEIHDKYAPEYTTGINLQQSIYYSLGKHIMIGIDLNLGLRAVITNGVKNRKESTIYYLYPVNNSVTDDYVTYKHSLKTSLYFQPAISIKYNFQRK